tara:strand:+ start:74 stop:1132 length:1059 start_codon:yes stop_codon:yes gene_type:complete
MPRSPRIEYENAIYHIMARGDRREPIVFDDEDRQTFIRTLAQVCRRNEWEVFAWVLMDNHYHLAVRTPKANLVSGMQWFQNTFTRRINVKHQLWGHLFGGRYKAILVEDSATGGESHWQSYLTTLIDYIHLNPARAGIVDGGETGVLEYPWSSVAQGYAKPPTKRPEWLAVKEGLRLLGERDEARGRRRYINRLDAWAAQEEKEHAGLVEMEGQSLQSTLRRGWYWGSQEFKERLLDQFGGSGSEQKSRNDRSTPMGRDHHLAAAEQIIEMACQHFGMKEEALFERRYGDRTRAAIAWKVWRHTSVPNQWIAERMNLGSPANVSQAVRRFEQVDESELAKVAREWKKKIVVT